jgi:hypothetical protein
MPRDLPLSNGTLLEAFDLQYRIRGYWQLWATREGRNFGNLPAEVGAGPAA